MKRTCDKCIHQDVCIEDSIISGIPFCNPDTCGYYQEPVERLQPKQVKNIYSDYNGNGAAGYCPNCGNGVMIKNTFVYNFRIKKGHYCEWCGQALDWGKDPFRNIGTFKSILITIKDYIKENPLDISLIIAIILQTILCAISILT